jgi:hypothetical protein
MPKMVTRFATGVTFAALLTIPWASTMAQPPFPPIPGRSPEVRGPTTTGNCPLIEPLKARLAITATQKSAWDDYAGALNSNLKSLQGVRETILPMRGKTFIEKFNAHVTATENRLKALNDLTPTLTALYAVLSVDQKKKADDFLLRMSCIM